MCNADIKEQLLRGSTRRLVAFIKLTPRPTPTPTPIRSWPAPLLLPLLLLLVHRTRIIYSMLPRPYTPPKVKGPKVVILEKFLPLIFNITGERK